MNDSADRDQTYAAPTFDREVLNDLREALEDEDLVLEIAHAFLRETPANIAALDALTRHGDARAIAAIAHRINGSALTFGASRLSSLCAAVERTPLEAGGLMVSMAREFEQLEESLRKYLDDLDARPE